MTTEAVKCNLVVYDGDKVEEKHKATVLMAGKIVKLTGTHCQMFTSTKHKPAMKQAIDYVLLNTTLFDPVTMRVTVEART